MTATIKACPVRFSDVLGIGYHWAVDTEDERGEMVPEAMSVDAYETKEMALIAAIETAKAILRFSSSPEGLEVLRDAQER